MPAPNVSLHNFNKGGSPNFHLLFRVSGIEHSPNVARALLHPVAPLRPVSHIGAMHLDLSDEEDAALTQELHDIAKNDRYPFSPRICTLRSILAKLRPEPVREPSPPPKVYAPPRRELRATPAASYGLLHGFWRMPQLDGPPRIATTL
jgi:hypothetical protein